MCWELKPSCFYSRQEFCSSGHGRTGITAVQRGLHRFIDTRALKSYKGLLPPSTPAPHRHRSNRPGTTPVQYDVSVPSVKAARYTALQGRQKTAMRVERSEKCYAL